MRKLIASEKPDEDTRLLWLSYVLAPSQEKLRAQSRSAGGDPFALELLRELGFKVWKSGRPYGAVAQMREVTGGVP